MVWETRSTPKSTRVYPNQEPITGDGIDLRAEIAHCLAKHGHTVFLRQLTGQPCACRSSLDDLQKPSPHNEFRVDCASCQGFGFMYRDRRIKAFNRPAFGTFGLTGAIQRAPLGGVNVADLVWYFEHDEQIRVGNHIIEVTGDDEGGVVQAINIERIHEIKQPYPARDRKGRVEFWEVLTREVVLGK